MGLSLRQKGLIVLTLAFAVQLAVLWISVGGHVRHVAAQRRTLDTLTTVNRAQSLLTLLVDAETGVRGFVIARRDAFLEPYLRARRDVPSRAAELVWLARADPQQATLARDIAEHARALLTWQDETIALARATGLGDTVLARSDEGKRRMDAIRVEVAALLDREQRRLDARQTALEGDEDRTVSVMIAASLLSVAVLMGVLLLFNRGIGRRLAQMVGNMEGFARGEPLRGKARGVDEIAQLDRALRQMAAELTSRRLARMQALADAAGLAVSGQRSRDELLQATSERARALLDAEHAEIWLPDATGDGAGLRRLREAGTLASPEELRTQLQTSKRPVRAAHAGVAWLGAPFLNSSMNMHGVLAVARRNGLPFSDEDEQVLAQLAQIASAIFEIRQAYDALEARARELALVNEDLAQKTQENELFVYSVSHDLRSPLVNLEGFSRELQVVGESLRTLLDQPGVSPAVRRTAGDLVDGDMAESIHFIGAAVERLSRIIDGLLQLSRAGRAMYRREVLDVTPLAQHVMARAQPRAAERGAVVSIAPYLGAVTADADGVEQVFAHLLDNALKYLDADRPGRIEFDVPAEPPPAGLHVVSIRDNGLGVAQAYQDKVFQPLQRVHVDAATGEGLGLTIVRRILDRMGGHVWMESEAGRGSTFFVALPAAAAAIHDPHPHGVPATAIPAPDGGPPSAR
jgi:signal transduction histidine kinase/CHASE3 domain sensor protein